jgi:hypothetical protein
MGKAEITTRMISRRERLYDTTLFPKTQATFHCEETARNRSQACVERIPYGIVRNDAGIVAASFFWPEL